ncbi:hypothetical protein Xszus_03851 [Xenorhabdus szentirmaii]|uniref:Uncharacterized protein n=1 Tax=Xenorhabdus szentirmaii DSM 16338 TaxID=1427518 RepID=W1IY17_9GAMM|nr:hypothetical protein Xsze_01693 [Xenorhabdus szentirmaii DSM 16338]PHM44027.1 hypothetical protein Xszus_03851 [Xenorhabdus szentirmaii]CDL82115.1 hypothetical protein XSR1_190048 [Xenorhabdus szentirmaii DSM 16338]
MNGVFNRDYKEVQYLFGSHLLNNYGFVKNNKSHNDLFHGVINNRSQ